MSYRESLFDVSATRATFLDRHSPLASSKDYWHVIPAWEHIMQAIQVLHESHKFWQFNVADEGRLWATRDGVFVAWASAWQDILLVLEEDHPACAEYILIARQLLIEGAIVPTAGYPNDSLWLIQPSNCRHLMGRPPIYNHKYMIKIRNPETLFDRIPEPIDVNIKER